MLKAPDVCCIGGFFAFASPLGVLYFMSLSIKQYCVKLTFNRL